MSTRDQRRAAKRREKRKAERLVRTGPAVSLGEIVDAFAQGLPAALGAPAHMLGLSAVGGGRRTVVRKHAANCEAWAGGVCEPGCETDAQLRARLQERFG